MVSNEMSTGEAEGTSVLKPGAGAPHSAASSQGEKGIFDQLAEYLLKQPSPGAEAPSSEMRVPEAPARPLNEPAPAQEPVPQQEAVAPKEAVPPRAEHSGMRSQELVFRETAEQLVVEKEAFVREEVVLSRLVKEHVEEIHDQVKRTEVEVERISPQEAQQIEQRDAPEPQRTSSTPEARPVAQSRSSTAPASRSSAAWWAWFALILCAAVLIAYALGQFLGSAS